MASQLGFGIGLPVVQQVAGKARAWESGAGPAEIERIARAADRLGFAHIACSDHVLVPRSRAEAMGTIWYESVATLAYLGGMTSRIELLTHVLVLPYHHPLALAKSLATVDAMTRGRLLVGVGSGHLKPEFKILKVPFDERAGMTDEYIDILRAAWQEGAPSFEGKYFQFHDVFFSPRPHRRPHPPIWVGGNAQRIVRRSVEHGDGWVPWQISTEDLRALVDFGQGIRAKMQSPRRWDVVAPFPQLDLLQRRRGAAGECFRGAPADAAAEMDRLRGMGVNRLQVSFASESCAELEEQLEAFAADVAPLL
jgi:probable F420-dependent oxidoreductase